MPPFFVIFSKRMESKAQYSYKNGPTPIALGGGVGLRHQYFDEIIAKKPKVSWFEIISEDFVNVGGKIREQLFEIRKSYPIIGHGVCLAIGSTDPLDMPFIKSLKNFLDEIDSPWASDHLCFTMVDHTNLNDLCPLPFTKECVKNCVNRIRIIQNELERPFLIENITRYITVSSREMAEIEFISQILEAADCGLLLDVTNVFLNGRFHNFDPLQFIQDLPLHRVGQIHLSGWDSSKSTVIDSHDAPVPEEIWSLFRKTIELTGPSSILVERDGNFPPLLDLVNEAAQAERVMWEAVGIKRGV